MAILLWMGHTIFMNQRPYLLLCFVMIVLGFLAVFLSKLTDVVSNYEKFFRWLLDDLMLLVAIMMAWIVENKLCLLSQRRISLLVAVSWTATILLFWGYVDLQQETNGSGDFVSTLLFVLPLLLSALWQFDVFMLVVCCGRCYNTRYGYSVLEEDSASSTQPQSPVVMPTAPINAGGSTGSLHQELLAVKHT